MEKEEKNTKEVEKAKLSVPATVILTIIAALGMIVLFRIMYYYIMGV